MQFKNFQSWKAFNQLWNQSKRIYPKIIPRHTQFQPHNILNLQNQQTTPLQKLICQLATPNSQRNNLHLIHQTIRKLIVKRAKIDNPNILLIRKQNNILRENILNPRTPLNKKLLKPVEMRVPKNFINANLRD